MVHQQQEIGRQRVNVVSEGRDQGTVVFPKAKAKFYLDASAQERARRRVAQLRARGEIVDHNDILDQIVTRDQRDSGREVGPLAIPADALVIDTTDLTMEQVVQKILARVEGR